jgi:integrase
MGHSTRGIYPESDGTWQVDKWWKDTRLRKRGFASSEEAQHWLIRQLEALRVVVIHGEKPKRTFDEAAAHYLRLNQAKTSIVTEAYLLRSVMPYIGALLLPQVHDASLAPYVSKRLAQGRAHKTVNLALGIVRRILNLAASAWRDENGHTWLERTPMITMLPLVGHQREPGPISWADQRALLPRLPQHLSRMALFVLNTGVRDDVVCNLRWAWEIGIPELGISVFEVPREHVKGRRRSRVVVCNSVAQSIIEEVRGMHDEFVFVYRRERVKNLDEAPQMPYRPIEMMNNTAWQRARREADLGDLHVHDLRHTVGMRLREAGVPESTRADILWHSSPSMTHHYSVAQIVELHAALEKVKEDNGRWNKSLLTLRREQEERRGFKSPPKVPQISPKRKNGLETKISKPLIRL